VAFSHSLANRLNFAGQETHVSHAFFMVSSSCVALGVLMMYMSEAQQELRSVLRVKRNHYMGIMEMGLALKENLT
jgi:hypothetical protein